MASAHPTVSAAVLAFVVVTLGLVGLAGCGEDPAPGPAAQPAVRGIDADVAALRASIEAAHRQWSDGERQAAADAVRRAYVDQFEPLEPAMRAQDAVATLEIEYGFGLLARDLEARGNPVQVSESVTQLIQQIEALAATVTG